MIGTIAAREFRTLFLSPLAWGVLAVVQFILAWLFLVQVDTFTDELQPMFARMDEGPGVTDLVAAPVFGTAALVLLTVVPLLTMRLIAEERRSGTLSLLMSSPVSMTQVVLGKYFGILGFLLIMVALVAAMPLSLAIGTSLDFGKLAAGVLGLSLLVAAFAAAGIWMSALTRQPVVAAVATFGLLLLLWMIDWAGGGGEDPGAMEYLSVINHFQALLQGRVNSADVIYYLLFITLFLGLAIHRLDARRLRD
jgi:ABC-2 type transport system permease protein